MKACPTCKRTFEESFTFCLIDGTVLSAPFDPQATKRIPEARPTQAPRTEVLPANLKPDHPVLPPTMRSPLLEPTQPHVPLQYSPPVRQRLADDKVATEGEPFGWILGGLAFGTVVGIIVGLSMPDAKSAIPLGVFGALLGALIGKLISRIIQKDSETIS